MEVKFFKLLTLPAVLENNAWYIIENGNYAETYITNNLGNAKMIGNSVMINNLISAQLTAISQTYVTADISERDILTASLNRNAIIQVINATADISVSNGGATYLWDQANNISIKISEFESMDTVLNWTSVNGRPTSTPGAIDASVLIAHEHTNKTDLDKITSVGGVIYYDNQPIKSWNTINW